MNLMRDKYIDTDLSSSCLVSDMKIDHIFQIGSLYTDCKWVSRMKCESYQSSSLRWRISTLNSCINFELEHSTLSAIKPNKGNNSIVELQKGFRAYLLTFSVDFPLMN